MGRSNINLSEDEKKRQKWFRKVQGTKIKTFRLRKGFDTDVMAEFLQISRNHYNKIEKGDVTVSDWYLGKINKVLELSSTELQSLLQEVDLTIAELKERYFLNLVKIEEIKEDRRDQDAK